MLPVITIFFSPGGDLRTDIPEVLGIPDILSAILDVGDFSCTHHPNSGIYQRVAFELLSTVVTTMHKKFFFLL